MHRLLFMLAALALPSLVGAADPTAASRPAEPSPPEGDGAERVPTPQQVDLDALRELLDAPIDRSSLERLHAGLIGSSKHPPPALEPDRAALLRDGLHHPDPRVRRLITEAWHPYMAGTRFDPIQPSEAPPLASSDLARLAADPHPAVRRRTLHLLRTAHPRLAAADLAPIYHTLLQDPVPSVRALALRCLPDAARRGLLSPEQAWNQALSQVHHPLPAGRAACNQLARLRPELASVTVDPAEAMERCLAHHPERAWAIGTAWRDVLPANEAWMRTLLHDTSGLSPALIQRWSELDRPTLDRLLRDWPPSDHPERQRLARALAGPAEPPPE